MTTLILQTTTRLMLPVLLLFSVFLWWRGHNEPGGGFTGGLVGASAFVLFALAEGGRAARRALVAEPHALMGTGLLLALAAGVLPLFARLPFLTSLGGEPPGASGLYLGTPLVFDAGVYLVVVGMALTIILPLTEE